MKFAAFVFLAGEFKILILFFLELKLEEHSRPIATKYSVDLVQVTVQSKSRGSSPFE